VDAVNVVATTPRAVAHIAEAIRMKIPPLEMIVEAVLSRLFSSV